MTGGLDELCRAGAKLLTSVAMAIDGYTELQKRRFDYYASQQIPTEQPAAPFEQYQPGYFEKIAESQLRKGR